MPAPGWPRAQVRGSGTQGLTANVEYVVPFATVDIDSHGMWSAGNPERLTVGYSGGYLLVGTVSTTASGGTPFWIAARLYVNGVIQNPAKGAAWGDTMTKLKVLVPGDVITLRAIVVDSGVTLSRVNCGLTAHRLWVDP